MYLNRQHHNYYREWLGWRPEGGEWDTNWIGFTAHIWTRIGQVNPITAYFLNRTLLPLIDTLQRRRDLASRVKSLSLPVVLLGTAYLKLDSYKIDSDGCYRHTTSRKADGSDLSLAVLQLLLKMSNLCPNLVRVELSPEADRLGALEDMIAGLDIEGDDAKEESEKKSLKSSLFRGAKEVCTSMLLSRPLRKPVERIWGEIPENTRHKRKWDEMDRRRRKQLRNALSDLISAVVPKVKSWRVGAGWPIKSIIPDDFDTNATSYTPIFLSFSAGHNIVHLNLMWETEHYHPVQAISQSLDYAIRKGLPNWDSLSVDGEFVSVLGVVPGNKLRMLQVRRWNTLEPILSYIKRCPLACAGTGTATIQSRLKSLTIDITPYSHGERTWAYGLAAEPQELDPFDILRLDHVYKILRHSPSLQELVVRRPRYEKDGHWKMRSEERQMELDWPRLDDISLALDKLGPPDDLLPGENWPPVAKNLTSLVILAYGKPLRRWLFEAISGENNIFPKLKYVDYTPSTLQLSRELYFGNVHRECGFYEFMSRDPCFHCISCGYSGPQFPWVSEKELVGILQEAVDEDRPLKKAAKSRGIQLCGESAEWLNTWGTHLPAHLRYRGPLYISADGEYLGRKVARNLEYVIGAEFVVNGEGDVSWIL